MEFTHLQVRSGYSLMKSSITIQKLVDQAAKLGFSSLALTDEGVLHGVIPFYQACKEQGIKPIIGLVVQVTQDDAGTTPCLLLALNESGYRNLIHLSTILQTQDEHIIDCETLSSHSDQLIGIIPFGHLAQDTSDSRQAGMTSILNYWKQMFSEGNFYLGIDENVFSFPGMDTELRNASLQAEVPVTVLNDVRYLSSQDYQAFDCLQAIRTGENWRPEQAVKENGISYLASEEEIWQAFDSWPEAVEESGKIAARCNVELDLNQRMLPSYPVPGGETASVYLKKLCYEKGTEIYGRITGKVEERLNYELEIITSMKFSDYFLIVWDFIQYAKTNQIMVGPGRGSAAGSLVAYVLGITEVDPLKYDLLFERFLNPERISMPDIDIDFSDTRREEVIQYVRNKYGEEHVAQIITYGTFAARSLLRELIKTMRIDNQDAAFIMKEIPSQSSRKIAEIVKASDTLTDYVKNSSELKTLFKVAAKLEGLPRHVSTHAAGIVISEQPLTQHVPLIPGQNGVALTQFAMKELETIGLLKMDFLGLRNLTLMERVLSSIKQKEKLDINVQDIPFDDKETFQLLKEGKTAGIFQLESSGMQGVLTNLLPTRFEDVVAVNALYRPGPMQYIPVYIKRKHGKENVSYPHPDLEPILSNTYGVLVYQEQIMQIANKMAGFSLGQSDILRRAVSKKQKEVMNKQKEAFIAGCIDNGYSETAAQQIFEWIVHFSNYGFNRSHAVAYSMISYQLAYLKAHYPSYFLAELMSSVMNQQDKIQLYIREAAESGVEVLPPSINKSSGGFKVAGNSIRMGLLSIKGVGAQAVREIVHARKKGPFKNLFDFCLRVSLKVVNRQVIESLIFAGSFDEVYNNRASLLGTIDQAMEQGELFGEFDDQQSLFHNTIELEGDYKQTEDFSEMRKLAFEKEVLGIYMSSHPLSKYREKLRSAGFVDLTNAKNIIGQNNARCAAVVQGIKTIRTKRGESMAFATLGDEKGQMDAVIFPELYRRVNRWLEEESMVLIKGKVENRNERLQWLLSDLEPFDEQKIVNRETRRVFVKAIEEDNQRVMNILKKISTDFPGHNPIIVYHADSKRSYQLSSNYNIKISSDSLNRLYEAFGKEHVAVK
ncbi:DNA polymerase III subunit alpha [Sediminibacillus massiliensis]|uniref:DNA polymerase III subunit alpha n=1 Tax=Sediminibacillus massiliensis TaxID=1926277 RepID=UPI000988784C|nr:DNA polymerase III subunit alpha [Sediminibacillus massiliensis]